MLDRDEIGYTNLVVAACFEAWQAAIQHARDVAEDCIEYELGETGQAKAIFHAIKEALNTGAATPGNKGTTPNS